MLRHALPLLLCSMLAQTCAAADAAADPALVAAIAAIKAVDNHAHALPASEPDAVDPTDPLGRTAFAYPVRLRVDNPEYGEAWRALYGYAHADMSGDHPREALRAKLDLMRKKGQRYPAWVLDQAGIDIMLVNNPVLGAGQGAPRFLWVPTGDGLLFPFDVDNADIGALRRQIAIGAAPGTLDAYVANIVVPALRQWKAGKAVAVKFTAAYFRSLDFAAVEAADAAPIYAKLASSPSATQAPAQLKTLQDYLFRTIAAEAGRLGLPVHIHTGVGADPYFDIGGSNPLLLEAAFNDPALRHTRFVMIHGGWPFEREAGVMLLKPNVYADFSAQAFLRSTAALSATLQDWLEFFPEKILFGTDAYSEETPLANWEEKTWLTTRTARAALALALTRMMAAGQITRPRAEQLARMVLRDNALRLYGLGGP